MHGAGEMPAYFFEEILKKKDLLENVCVSGSKILN
jgi:hypothetical protein